MNTFKPTVSLRLAWEPIILTSLALMILSSGVACEGASASPDAGVGPDATNLDVRPSRQDVPAADLRPKVDAPVGPPTFIGRWAYVGGANQLTCGEQRGAKLPSSGQLSIAPALDGGLDVEDGGCRIHFVVEGTVAKAAPPAQECGSNTTPANWTLTLKADGSMEEIVVGSIQVENVSCFIDGMSTLGRL